MGIKILIHRNGNGNRPVGMGGNGNTDCVPAHLHAVAAPACSTALSSRYCSSLPIRLTIAVVGPAGDRRAGSRHTRQ